MKDKYSRYYTKVKFVYLLIVFDKLFQKKFCVYGQVQLNLRKDRLMSVLLQIINHDPYLCSQPATCRKYKVRKTKILSQRSESLFFLQQSVENAQIQKHEPHKFKIKVPIQLSTTDQQEIQKYQKQLRHSKIQNLLLKVSTLSPPAITFLRLKESIFSLKIGGYK